MNKINHQYFASFIALGIVLIIAQTALAQDLKPEEIVEKHITAIGGRTKLDTIKNRFVAGASEFESKLPSRKTGGKAVIASDKNNLMFLASFASKEYPKEKIGYFTDKVSLPWVTSGTRSPLGAFLADHEKVLSDGLFGGTISSTWAILTLDSKKPLLKSGGSKKLDGRKAYAIDYFPKGSNSSEFTIRLFFDSETFNHVRTEYRHTISAGQDKFGQLGRQAGVKIGLTEIFGDFKTVDGFTFPYDYRAEYRTESNSGTYEWVWGVKVTQYLFDQNLAADFFNFEEK
ncbi:MAG TPA: hypothetical protein VK612_09140 [Pyrinomonadaceae bacterium]|nr:hypothetical protein [Pyrinomonadaceae bacterium]